MVSSRLGSPSRSGVGTREGVSPGDRVRPFRSAVGQAPAVPAYVALHRRGELARRERALWELARSCRLCPRRCGVDRPAGERGECRLAAGLRVYSVGPRFGEVRALVGRGGSGAVVFSGCSLRCCFCSTAEVSHRAYGRAVSPAGLAGAMLGLQRRGCHNIHLVTPSPQLPAVVGALRLAVEQGLALPVVYSTGGYESLDVLALLDGVVDVYLTDFKFQDGGIADTYCQGARDYPEAAARAVKAMHRQVGDLQLDARGVAVRGLLVRHLVMPRNAGGTDRFVRWVASELSPWTAVSLLGSFRPRHRARDYPAIARPLAEREWQQALRWAREAGLRNLVS